MSLSVALFYELCWLDVIPAGTFIPPQLAASTLACLTMGTRFGVTEPPMVLVPIVASMPLAWLGIRMEAGLRNFNNRAYNTLLGWGRSDDTSDIPLVLIGKSLMFQLLASWAFFFVSMLVLDALLGLVLPLARPLAAWLDVGWPHLWLAASFGGLMALRLRGAYLALAAGVAAIGLAAYAEVF